MKHFSRMLVLLASLYTSFHMDAGNFELDGKTVAAVSLLAAAGGYYYYANYYNKSDTSGGHTAPAESEAQSEKLSAAVERLVAAVAGKDAGDKAEAAVEAVDDAFDLGDDVLDLAQQAQAVAQGLQDGVDATDMLNVLQLVASGQATVEEAKEKIEGLNAAGNQLLSLFRRSQSLRSVGRKAAKKRGITLEADQA